MNPIEDLKKRSKDLDLKGIGKNIEMVFGKLNQMSKSLGDEVLRIHKPKEKKEIEINGKKCEISLIEDGRIMITFPDISSTDDFYKYNLFLTPEKLNEIRAMEHKSGRGQGVLEGRSQKANEFNKLPFFKRLFTTWLLP